MPITVSDYIDVIGQATKLDLNVPQGLSILPRNFDVANEKGELLHESSVATVRSLFRQNGVTETKLEKAGEQILSLQQNEFALTLPIIFVSALLYSQNPELVTIALNILSNYATDFFKGIPRKRKVVLDVVVEKKAGRHAKRLHYEGDGTGLKEVADAIREVFNEPN